MPVMFASTFLLSHAACSVSVRKLIENQMETRGETVLATHATAHTLEEVCVPVRLLKLCLSLVWPGPELNITRFGDF